MQPASSTCSRSRSKNSLSSLAFLGIVPVLGLALLLVPLAAAIPFGYGPAVPEGFQMDTGSPATTTVAARERVPAGEERVVDVTGSWQQTLSQTLPASRGRP